MATAARGAGGKSGGRGHRRDGSGNQARDNEIDAALTQCGALGVRKQVKTVVADAMLHLKAAGKAASESRVRERRLKMVRKSSLKP